jgi:hypothetical protein
MDEHRERSTTVPSDRRPGRWSRLLLAGATLAAGAACESGRAKRPEVATTTASGPMVERYLMLALFPERLVIDVEPGGGAERAGVRVGDVVLAVDGQAADSLGEPAGAVRSRGNHQRP